MIATPPSTLHLSNFRAKTVGPIRKIFSWTDAPRMRLQQKICLEQKLCPFPRKTGKTCWGGGGFACTMIVKKELELKEESTHPWLRLIDSCDLKYRCFGHIEDISISFPCLHICKILISCCSNVSLDREWENFIGAPLESMED